MKRDGTKKLSDRPQFNVRLPDELKNKMDAEIARQGRKRDAIAARIIEHFLSMKSSERDAICSRAA